MSDLHTYRFPFKDGSVFRTNAPSYDSAMKNFRTTFSDLDIHQRGGVAFPFAVPRKMAEPVNFFTGMEVSAITGVSVKLLHTWQQKGAVRSCTEPDQWSWDALSDVQNCLRLKRKFPHYYLTKAREALYG